MRPPQRRDELLAAEMHLLAELYGEPNASCR